MRGDNARILPLRYLTGSKSREEPIAIVGMGCRFPGGASAHPDSGKTYSRVGGYLQERMLLEVSWEALENAAQAPSDWSGSSTGVFIGISYSDYAPLQGDI